MAIPATDKPLLARVKEVLSREDTVLFIGAGLSRWSNLPDWTQLLEELAGFIEQQGYSSDLVRRELAGNDLLQAANYGVDQLTPPQFGQFIRQACRVGVATPHEIHRKVVTLGPRSFITTNYDRLIEDSLNKWYSDQFFQVVSNKQLPETADIVQARAKYFIFKPHGDVGDVDSIILSREQYRILYTDRRHILKALETLLVSRPVVFIGFGLRDIDFFYVKDLLASTYKGGTIDHYAIMPDVSEQERLYWRKNYGIHILPYTTTQTPVDGSRHTALLEILDELLERPSERTNETKEEEQSSSSSDTISASQVLALARYASRLISLFTLKAPIELPLRISIRSGNRVEIQESEWLYHKSLVENFLTNSDFNALLLGNPGAGKSYAFKKVSLKLAQELQAICLNDSVQIPDFGIPVYVDLKLYKGNVWQLAEQALPPAVSLEYLIQHRLAKFYLDSFNEMPREHFESGEYERDFNEFFGRVEGCPVLIGSRTDEGLQKFQLPVFWLDEIDRDFVEEYLRERGNVIEGRFIPEVITLLQKPLFFKLYLEGKISVVGETHPHQVYGSLFNKLTQDFKGISNVTSSIEIILSPIAYNAMEEGREALILTDFLSQLRLALQQTGNADVDGKEFVNWLISREILIPASGKRLTFFHQSITEYLAALELARLYKAAPQALERSLKFTRWDQAIFLTLGFLDEGESDRFIQQVLEADLSLAIRAAKFVEFNRDLVVMKILQELQSQIGRFDLSPMIQQLPVTSFHKKILKNLMKAKNDIGGTAAYLLASIPHGVSKEELVEELFKNPDDYNFCTQVGASLVNKLESDDLKSILNRVGELQIDHEFDVEGLNNGLEIAFQNIPTNEMLSCFPPWESLNKAQLTLLCGLLESDSADTAVSLSIDMLLGGVSSAVFPLYFQLRYPGEGVSVNAGLLNKEVLIALFKTLSDNAVGQWAVNAIQNVIQLRPDLSEVVSSEAKQSSGVIKLALLYSVATEQAAFWDAMEELSTLSPADLENEPIHLLNALDDLNWVQRETLVLKLLKQRNTKVARELLEALQMRRGRQNELEIPKELLEPIDFWLEWMAAESSAEWTEGFWFCDRLANFLINFTSSEIHSLFIDEFNRENSPYRLVLFRHILKLIPELTSDKLNESAIQYLLSTLNQDASQGLSFLQGPVIGIIATESFVEERLLPLLSIDTEPFKSNLRLAIKTAGGRYQRRYISETT